MDRRRFLRATGAALPLGLAGCLGLGGSGDGGSGTTTGASPTTGTAATTTGGGERGIYVQPFLESMSDQGTATAGDYAFGLLFAVPHVFWTVTGSELSRHEESGSLHLMATVWDPETRTVIPETGLSVEISRDGDLVSEEVIYPMLSQRMGFHYGANFGLDGDGTYDVSVSVSGTPVRRTGAFAGKFGDPATAEMTLEFTDRTRDQVGTREIEQAGDPGAVRPMNMEMMPVGSQLPPAGELPGTPRGTATSDDAVLAVTTVEGAGDRYPGDPYLAVSARTRYNRLVIPAMGLSATLTRDGETVYDGPLERTLDPDLGYHYGAAVDSVRAGDELALSVTTPPQVARHEGYERAFLEMPDVTVTL